MIFMSRKVMFSRNDMRETEESALPTASECLLCCWDLCTILPRPSFSEMTCRWLSAARRLCWALTCWYFASLHVDLYESESWKLELDCFMNYNEELPQPSFTLILFFYTAYDIGAGGWGKHSVLFKIFSLNSEFRYRQLELLANSWASE